MTSSRLVVIGRFSTVSKVMWYQEDRVPYYQFLIIYQGHLQKGKDLLLVNHQFKSQQPKLIDIKIYVKYLKKLPT